MLNTRYCRPQAPSNFFLFCAMFLRGWSGRSRVGSGDLWLDLCQSDRTQASAICKDLAFRRCAGRGVCRSRWTARSSEEGLVAAALRFDQHGSNRGGRAEGVGLAAENQTDPRLLGVSMGHAAPGCEISMRQGFGVRRMCFVAGAPAAIKNRRERRSGPADERGTGGRWPQGPWSRPLVCALTCAAARGAVGLTMRSPGRRHGHASCWARGRSYC
jgi:hypothetical protein